LKVFAVMLDFAPGLSFFAEVIRRIKFAFSPTITPNLK
jgi:hypothetical protein